MANLKSLAKDTAIYGLSSIVGRFLNYLLVPLYTAKMAASTGGYGVVTNVYAWTALLLVILTFGMETTFFRFANKAGENAQRVYSTTLIAVGSIAFLFAILCWVFVEPLSQTMGYAAHPEYIGIMATVVAFDAFQSIPFAYLRYQKRALKFAGLKLLCILVNILLNLFIFLLAPVIYEHAPETIDWFYKPDYGAGYVFIINLISTAFITFFFIPELSGFRYVFDRPLFRKMIKYAFPLLLLGVAGILNQTIDKILFPLLTDNNTVELGIYGAASKIAMIIVMFTQSFRYAYEPFIFGKSQDKDNLQTLALGMKFFIIFSLLAFLVVMFYMDLIRYIISPDYWPGLKVVPIIMAAEIFMGIYFNLSFWYKLIDDTKWGAIFSGAGCAVLVVINVVFVPRYGYIACAWAGFAGYATSMLLSYFVGQKRNRIPYDIKGIAIYMMLAIALYYFSTLITVENVLIRLLINTLFLALFVAYIIKKDFPLKHIPFVNRFIKH